MLKQHKRTLIFTSLIFLIPVLIGLLLWDRLPDALPSHWNIHGEVDSWTPKAVAILDSLVCFWCCTGFVWPLWFWIPGGKISPPRCLP